MFVKWGARCFKTLSAVVGLCLPLHAFTEDSVTRYTPSVASSGVPSLGGTLLHVLLVLLFVVGLIIFSAWVAKRLRFNHRGHAEKLSAMAVLPLGTKEKAVMIEASGKKMLLGVASGHVSLLHVFDDQDASARPEKSSQLAEEASQSESNSSLPVDPNIDPSSDHCAGSNSEHGFTHFLRLALAEKIAPQQHRVPSSKEGNQ